MSETQPLRLVLVTIALTIILHLAHEAAHLLAAMSYGYSGSAGLNSVSTDGFVLSGDQLVITLAGPALMLLVALVAAVNRSRWAPTILFAVFVQRLLAALVSFMSPNDEARAGEMLGVGSWSLFVVSVGLTGWLFIHRYRRDRLGVRWLLLSWIGISIGIMMMVFGEPFVPRITF